METIFTDSIASIIHWLTGDIAHIKLYAKTTKIIHSFMWGCNGASQNQHPISCAKSVGCGFLSRSKLVPAIIAGAIQLSNLKSNSYEPAANNDL